MIKKLLVVFVVSQSFFQSSVQAQPLEKLSPEERSALGYSVEDKTSFDLGYSVPSIEELTHWLSEQNGKLKLVKSYDYPEVEGFELHPQGMVKLGNDFILSSVDTRGKKKSNKDLEVGFLQRFTINADNEIELIKQQQINGLKFDYEGQEMSDHHPGGLDVDRETGDLIASVAQYKANSSSTFLIINSEDISDYEVAVRVDDHIGTIVCAKQGGESCRVVFNWDSKQAYKLSSAELRQSGMLKISSNARDIARPWAFQDCKYIGNDEEDSVYALCSATKPDYSIVLMKYTVGGDVVEVNSAIAPTVGGFLGIGAKSMAQNPMAFEKVKTDSGYKIRFYFIPHNHTDARLYIYDTDEVITNELSPK